MINAITPAYPPKLLQIRHVQPAINNNQPDSMRVENPYIDKKPLIDRKIIDKDENINVFFDKISSEIFKDSNLANAFSQLLKCGYVSLSSSCYENLKVPYSAIATKLNPEKLPFQNCAYLEEYIKEGIGLGINFNNFKNPTEQIKYINNYFNYRQPALIRPPAAMALLSINHPKILDFIKLKDNANYKDWCFDLSVIADDKFLSLVDTNQKLKMQDGSEVSAKEIYDTLLNSMKKSGEPGIIFSNNKNFICDCCNASELQEGQTLTLAHVNLSKFYNSKTKSCDLNLLKQSSNILTQALKNIDKNGYIGILGYQELLNQMGLEYGSKEANKILEDCLAAIKTSGCKMALSPTGTTSRVLKTTPSIEPSDNTKLTYRQEIDTMAHAQKYLEGGISKTIKLKENATIKDIDEIIRYCKTKNLKGITVF